MTTRRELPAVGMKIHFDPSDGEPNINAWSGEVRALVDDEFIVVRRWFWHKKYWHYFIDHRWWWDTGKWKVGPLPKSAKVYGR